MFNLFRFQYLPASFQKLDLTSRLFSDFVGFWNRGVAPQKMRRWGTIALLAIALWFGAAAPAPVAQAAVTPEAEEYDPGPIRQTRNPLSGENFNGGVEPTALKRTEARRQPEEDHKGLLGTIKDKITGNDAQETPADMKTQKNPTLERYPQSLD